METLNINEKESTGFKSIDTGAITNETIKNKTILENRTKKFERLKKIDNSFILNFNKSISSLKAKGIDIKQILDLVCVSGMDAEKAVNDISYNVFMNQMIIEAFSPAQLKKTVGNENSIEYKIKRAIYLRAQLANDILTNDNLFNDRLEYALKEYENLTLDSIARIIDKPKFKDIKSVIEEVAKNTQYTYNKDTIDSLIREKMEEKEYIDVKEIVEEIFGKENVQTDSALIDSIIYDKLGVNYGKDVKNIIDEIVEDEDYFFNDESLRKLNEEKRNFILNEFYKNLKEHDEFKENSEDLNAIMFFSKSLIENKIFSDEDIEQIFRSFNEMSINDIFNIVSNNKDFLIFIESVNLAKDYKHNKEDFADLSFETLINDKEVLKEIEDFKNFEIAPYIILADKQLKIKNILDFEMTKDRYETIWSPKNNTVPTEEEFILYALHRFCEISNYNNNNFVQSDQSSYYFDKKYRGSKNLQKIRNNPLANILEINNLFEELQNMSDLYALSPYTLTVLENLVINKDNERMSKWWGLSKDKDIDIDKQKNPYLSISEVNAEEITSLKSSLNGCLSHARNIDKEKVKLLDLDSIVSTYLKNIDNILEQKGIEKKDVQVRISALERALGVYRKDPKNEESKMNLYTQMNALEEKIKDIEKNNFKLKIIDKAESLIIETEKILVESGINKEFLFAEKNNLRKAIENYNKEQSEKNKQSLIDALSLYEFATSVFAYDKLDIEATTISFEQLEYNVNSLIPFREKFLESKGLELSLVDAEKQSLLESLEQYKINQTDENLKKVYEQARLFDEFCVNSIYNEYRELTTDDIEKYAENIINEVNNDLIKIGAVDSLDDLKLNIKNALSIYKNSLLDKNKDKYKYNVYSACEDLKEESKEFINTLNNFFIINTQITNLVLELKESGLDENFSINDFNEIYTYLSETKDTYIKSKNADERLKISKDIQKIVDNVDDFVKESTANIHKNLFGLIEKRYDNVLKSFDYLYNYGIVNDNFEEQKKELKELYNIVYDATSLSEKKNALSILEERINYYDNYIKDIVSEQEQVKENIAEPVSADVEKLNPNDREEILPEDVVNDSDTDKDKNSDFQQDEGHSAENNESKNLKKPGKLSRIKNKLSKESEYKTEGEFKHLGQSQSKFFTAGRIVGIMVGLISIMLFLSGGIIAAILCAAAVVGYAVTDVVVTRREKREDNLEPEDLEEQSGKDEKIQDEHLTMEETKQLTAEQSQPEVETIEPIEIEEGLVTTEPIEIKEEGLEIPAFIETSGQMPAVPKKEEVKEDVPAIAGAVLKQEEIPDYVPVAYENIQGQSAPITLAKPKNLSKFDSGMIVLPERVAVHSNITKLGPEEQAKT